MKVSSHSLLLGALCAVWATLTGCGRNPPSLMSNATATNVPVILSQPPPVEGSIIQETNADWGVLLHQERYRVINNVWNKNIASGAYQQKVFLEMLDGKGAFGWQWSWPRARDVMAYPEVAYGDKPWDPPSGVPSEFPFPVSSRKLAVNFDIRLTATGRYSLIFTLWGIANTNNPKGSITHEIMIWIANQGGSPAGTQRGTLLVSGVNFDVYVNPHQSDNSGLNKNQWTYVAFVAQTPLLKGHLDLDAMITHLRKQGLMADSTFLTCVELGTEILGGEGTEEFLDYAVTVASR